MSTVQEHCSQGVKKKSIDVVCDFFFRCVNSISRLCLCLRDTSLNFKLAIRKKKSKKKNFQKNEIFKNKFLLKIIF